MINTTSAAVAPGCVPRIETAHGADVTPVAWLPIHGMPAAVAPSTSGPATGRPDARGRGHDRQPLVMINGTSGTVAPGCVPRIERDQPAAVALPFGGAAWLPIHGMPAAVATIGGAAGAPLRVLPWFPGTRAATPIAHFQRPAMAPCRHHHVSTETSARPWPPSAAPGDDQRHVGNHAPWFRPSHRGGARCARHARGLVVDRRDARGRGHDRQPLVMINATSGTTPRGFVPRIKTAHGADVTPAAPGVSIHGMPAAVATIGGPW